MNKTVFLLGDFNIDLLFFEQHSLSDEFLDFLSSHILLPHNVQSTIIRNNSKTLIDNIYSNLISPNNMSGNLIATISDHLPKFIIAPDFVSNTPSTKLNIFEKDWFIFRQ